MIKKLVALSFAAGALVASAGGDALVRKPYRAGGMSRAETLQFRGFSKMKAPGDLKASFTCDIPEAHAASWTENFDNGSPGWIMDNTSYVTWTTKRIAEAGNARSFSAIDPEDAASLYVEGPYQTFRREISSATSPEMTVPANGALLGYVGFSMNYDEMCRLIISVSDDGFNTSTEIWNSKDETGDKTWRWHPVNVPLDTWSGRQIKIRLTYSWGSADEGFKTGGYLGDFAIDGLKVTGLVPVEGVSVSTGQTVRMVNLTDDEASSIRWSFPGGFPESSGEPSPEVYYTADGDYDVSLEVVTAGGQTLSHTIPSFVHVTGVSPVAKILPPATFRYSVTRNPLVAPLVPVTFSDASSGFPDTREWTFGGLVTDAPDEIVSSAEPSPSVSYAYRHVWPVGLSVSNRHGSSSDMIDVSVEYEGLITNLMPSDYATTFDMEDWGTFPGSNTRKITAYAEKFSKPSAPVIVNGAYVYFTKAEAEELVDQIANVGVHLYTSEDGKPGKRIDSSWWSVFELDTPSSANDLVGTAFPFTENPVIDDEFFIVVDGIPEKKDGTDVAFAMAGFRDEGNTAWMLKDGEWIEASAYFPAGANHTSYLIYPSVIHSVLTPLPVGRGDVESGPDGGTFDYTIFSYLGYETPVESDASWCRVIGEPNGLTVDDLKIECDPLPKGINDREAHLTVTDGASTMVITVRQSASGYAGLARQENIVAVTPGVFDREFEVCYPAGTTHLDVMDMNGRCVYSADPDQASGRHTIDGEAWPPGIYVVIVQDKALKVIRR